MVFFTDKADKGKEREGHILMGLFFFYLTHLLVALIITFLHIQEYKKMILH